MAEINQLTLTDLMIYSSIESIWPWKSLIPALNDHLKYFLMFLSIKDHLEGKLPI